MDFHYSTHLSFNIDRYTYPHFFDFLSFIPTKVPKSGMQLVAQKSIHSPINT